tara:strand:- start:699 stop:980 length:282 start_codon:yes stop_codon:yes gene_type:complete
MFNTITLPDGRLKHKIEGWTGYQNPGESMTKTKWFKHGTKQWEIKSSSKSKPGVVYSYTVLKDNLNKFSCTCLGFRYKKKCKHITEVVGNDRG